VVGAAVAQFVYTEKVIGSNPILPTRFFLVSRDRVMVARLAHNQKILGSNPSLATKVYMSYFAEYIITIIFEFILFIFQIKEERKQKLIAKFASKQK
jgi:hypothetical protein